MTSDSFASVMLGLGSYAPELRLTNEELSQRMDTSDEWIVSRTGIRERRIAAADETTSDLALSAARNALDEMCLYPDGNGFDLKQALARRFGVEMSQITLGNGSNDVLEVIARCFVDSDSEVVFSQYAFAVYPLVTQAIGARGVAVPAKDWGHDLDAMADAVTERTKLVFVANPNNPTGQLLDADELEAFIRAVPGHAIVCVDEAYIHFVDDPKYRSMIPLTKELDNLLVTRTFSKAYGLGGVRVGYGIAQQELLDRLTAYSVGWLNKNTLSIAAALGALEDQAHVRRSVKVAKEGKAYLYKELLAMGYQPLRTQTIFVTVDVGFQAESLVNRLAERKVNVRQAFDMEGYMRISVGLPHENEAFISAFKTVRSAL